MSDDVMSAVDSVAESGKSAMGSALDRIESILEPTKAPPAPAKGQQAKGSAPAAKTPARGKPATVVEEEPLDDPRLAEGEAETAAPEGEPEPEADAENPADAETEGEVALPETVEGLAETLGLEPDDILGLKVKQGDKEVTLKEALANAGQGSEEVTKLKAEVEQQRESITAEKQQFETTVKEYSERFTGGVKYLAHLIQAGEQFITADGYSQEQLDALFESDHIAYQRIMRGRSQREGYLDKVKNGFQELRQQESQQAEKRQNESQTQRQERVRRGLEALAKAVPELAPGNPKRGETSAAIVQYAVAQGFKPEDVQRAADNGDHRIISILNDARLYRQGQASKGDVVKKIIARKLPKLSTPNGRAPKADARVESARKAKTQLRRTGSQRDAEIALAALIG